MRPLFWISGDVCSGFRYPGWTLSLLCAGSPAWNEFLKFTSSVTPADLLGPAWPPSRFWSTHFGHWFDDGFPCICRRWGRWRCPCASRRRQRGSPCGSGPSRASRDISSPDRQVSTAQALTHPHAHSPTHPHTNITNQSPSLTYSFKSTTKTPGPHGTFSMDGVRSLMPVALQELHCIYYSTDRTE